MSFDLRTLQPADRERLRALLQHPSLAGEFDEFQGPHGLEHKLADPRLIPESIRLAWDGGEPVGFAFVWLLPQREGTWAMSRVAVIAAQRRRGIGTALARDLVAFVRTRVPSGARIPMALSAWMPSPQAEALAAKLGFAHERWFWLMERPRGAVPAPAWPAGIETRGFEGGERAIADWTQAYNASFASHYRSVNATAETTRRLVSAPGFRSDGVILAYRDGRCVGFCRDELYPSRGEIGVIGTTPDARGIGLGRALLRWGVAWLETHSSAPVTLLVDGENERALSLYRSERFEVARTRRIWGRELEGVT